ncbi:MAG: HAD family phosphatase [Ruminococcaceae bacterium]|nr:HAD family phosphatase [Oscillospiraceae bacterium]
MLKNYIFDFGNVLANFYPEQLTAPFVQDKELCRKISEVVFDRILWDPLDAGKITDEALKEEICKRLPPKWAEIGCRVYDNWISSLTPVAGMTELVEEMKRADMNLYLLSNISIGFAEGHRQVPWICELLSGFRGCVFSGTIGITKPGKEIFDYLLKTYSLKADECLFIDDSIMNIKGAETVGINGYLFDGDAEKLRDYLVYNKCRI